MDAGTSKPNRAAPRQGIGGRILACAAATQTAVVLLSVLAFVLVFATVSESVWSREVVRHYVYRSWWFIVLNSLVACNLVASLLVHLPRRWSQLGFVVTHLAVIVLLVGIVLSLAGGFEGRLLLRKGVPADTIRLVHQYELRVTKTDGAESQLIGVYRFEVPGAVDDQLVDPGRPGNPLQLRVLDIRAAAPSSASDSARQLDVATGLPQRVALVQLQADVQLAKVWLEQNRGGQSIELDDASYRLELRSPRVELGFSLELLDHRRVSYPGGYGEAKRESDVRVVDEQTGVSQESLVAMNQPLSYQGYRFYQGESDSVAAPQGSVLLMVAKDPGRRLKYLGGIGICFGVVLTFIRAATAHEEGSP